MTNSERRVTYMPKLVEPPGEALPDWKIISLFAYAMGFGANFMYRVGGRNLCRVRGAHGRDFVRYLGRELRATQKRWTGAVAVSEIQTDRRRDAAV